MKSIVINKALDIEMKETPKPTPKANHAIINVEAVGICGSDLTAYKGVNPTITYPLTIGHEISGTIDWIDPDADTDLKLGDKVVIEPYINCGKCYACERGLNNNCENLQVYGGHIDGGLSEQFQVPLPFIYKIPADMSFEHATLVEPLTISLHGLARSNVKKGDFVAITGAGTIGLLAALGCKSYGATPILLDIVQERLDFAKSLGVDNIINSMDDDYLEQIEKITNGRLADVMIECSGAESVLKDIPKYVTHGGNISFVGWPSGNVELPVIRFMQKELNLYGSRCSLNQFPNAINLIHSKEIDAEKIISKVVSLDKTIDMIKEMNKNPQDYIKVVCTL